MPKEANAPTLASVKEAVEPFINPISDDKAAQSPGLLPYAHTSGSALIKPEDTGKIKGRSITAMRQQTTSQMDQLYGQMKTLIEQARAVQERVAISERIYDAEMGFEPIINHVYYLYERKNGTDFLSMISPEEWGRSFPFRAYLAKVYLLADHTWDVQFNNTATEAEDVTDAQPD